MKPLSQADLKAVDELRRKIRACFQKSLVHQQEVVKAVAGGVGASPVLLELIHMIATEENYVSQADGWFARYVGRLPGAEVK